MARPSAFSLTNPGPLRLYSTTELLKLPPPEWLIDGIMPCRGLIGLYGPPGIKKSFLALDFAMSVGSGTPWAGRTVKRGPVLYIAAEGGSGMGKRAQAWLIDRQQTTSSVVWLLNSLPIYGKSEQIDYVMEKIHDEVQIHPRLVVIDTLARCFDGNENEQEDMGRFVAGADRFRTEFDAVVIVVHHTRLDGDRERGNTAFRGAADTMLSLERDKQGLWLKCNKQKDAEEFEKIELIFHAIHGTDSGVLHTPLASPNADIVRDLLAANPRMTFSQWAHAAMRLGVSRATFARRLKELKAAGDLLKLGHEYTLVNP